MNQRILYIVHCDSLIVSFTVAGFIMAPKKVGQELGEVRSSLPLEKLVPYLEKHVQNYSGPLEVQQFKFGQVSPSPFLSLT